MVSPTFFSSDIRTAFSVYFMKLLGLVHVSRRD